MKCFVGLSGWDTREALEPLLWVSGSCPSWGRETDPCENRSSFH